MKNDSSSTPRSFYRGSRSALVIATFVVIGALLSIPIFISSASSAKIKVRPSDSQVRIDHSTSSPYRR